MMHDLSEAGLNRRAWVTTAVGEKKKKSPMFSAAGLHFAELRRA
jgi:hypothetical protein